MFADTRFPAQTYTNGANIYLNIPIKLVLRKIEIQDHTHAQNSETVYGVASPLRALQRQRQKQKYQSRLEQSILG